MIADTSAWIEYLRKTGSPAHLRLRRHIGDGARLVVPEPVLMELLAGPPGEAEAAGLRRVLSHFEMPPCEPFVDAEAAAGIQRACARNGERVRSIIDCLIAAVALRLDVPVLHRDRDFEVMARHVGLRTVSELN
ncbi:MAG: domain nuclease [Acidimicrobiales bacterium]|nr:domain nuclease [Acidimicrobiales bacterium]